jgi:hypothetical protein
VWSSVLVDDLTGAGVGEVSNSYDRTLSWRVRRVTTAHFAVRLDDPLADRLLGMDLLVKLYNDDWGPAPAFVGEITDVEEVVSGSSKRLGITAQDASWRLAGRLIGKSTAGYTASPPTTYTAALVALLAEVNAQDDTGLRAGVVEPGGADFLGPWYYRPLGEVLAELAATLDGPEWRVRGVEPTVDGTGLKWGELDLVNAVGGALRDNAVFGYSDAEDDRGNVNDYRRLISKQGMLNTGYALPPGFPDTTQGDVQQWHDATARARWHWREGVIPGDIADNALRLKLVQQHVAVRKGPRETIVIGGLAPGVLAAAAADVAYAGRPAPYMPRFGPGQDYDLGDILPFRASVDGQARFDGLVRCYGVDLVLDNLGNETPTLSVTPED